MIKGNCCFCQINICAEGETLFCVDCRTKAKSIMLTKNMWKIFLGSYYSCDTDICDMVNSKRFFGASLYAYFHAHQWKVYDSESSRYEYCADCEIKKEIV